MPALGAAAIASRSWNGKKGADADAEETPPLIKFTEDTCDIEDEAIEKARQLFQRNAFVHSTGRMHWNDVITFLRMVGTNPRPDTVNSWVAANEGKLRAEGERPGRPPTPTSCLYKHRSRQKLCLCLRYVSLKAGSFKLLVLLLHQTSITVVISVATVVITIFVCFY